MRDVGRTVRLASDSRSATYLLFFVLILWELKLFGLLSFGFPSAVGLGEKWNRRIVFSDVMQSERGFSFYTKDCMHSESEHPVFDTYRFHLFITDYHFELIKLKCHPFLSRVQSPSLRHLQHQQQFY